MGGWKFGLHPPFRRMIEGCSVNEQLSILVLPQSHQHHHLGYDEFVIRMKYFNNVDSSWVYCEYQYTEIFPNHKEFFIEF